MNLDSDELYFVPLGGSGEIGMNANLYHHQGKWLMIDLGISFPDESLPGVDVVLPDLSFIEARKQDLLGIVLTHAHEDHFGAIPYLWERLQVPVYGTAFTLALLRRKLAEARQPISVPMHQLDYNIDYQFGPFSVELVALSHSIPDPAALVLRTPAGTVLHTGDWKLDDTPMLGQLTDTKRLEEIGKQGVLALIGDSTNAMVAGRTPSEKLAREGLTKVIGRAKGRVAVTCFASNVARLDSIIAAAAANDRSVCVVGRALHRTIAAAREAGYLADLPDFVAETDAGLLPADSLVIICTGTQGEPRAALARIAAGTHENIDLESGDMVIYSSRQIPGNEPAIAKIQDRLVRRRIEVVTDEDEMVHVSGHPARDELSELYHLVRPQIAIPVHGTARHLLAHARLAESCQVPQALIPDNGDIICLTGGKARPVGQAEVGMLTHEGGEIIDIQSDRLRARRQMLWNGTVTASLLLNGAGGLVLAPSVSQNGLCEGEAESDFLADAALAIEDMMDAMSRADRASDELLENSARSAIRGLARRRFGLRPAVQLHIMRAEASELG